MTISISLKLKTIFSVVALCAACGCQSTSSHLLSGILPGANQNSDARQSRGRTQQSLVSDQERPPTPAVSEKNFANVQLALGRSLEKEGNFKAAEAAYQAAIRNDATLAGAYHRMALLAEKSGRSDESQVHLEKALKLDPDNAELHCDLGYWHYLRKDWQQAEQHLRHSLTLDGDLKRAHNNMGMLLARNGDADQAARHFQLAGLSTAQIHNNLGFAHLIEGRSADAEVALNRATTADPQLVQAETTLASLRSARDNAIVTKQPYERAKTDKLQVRQPARKSRDVAAMPTTIDRSNSTQARNRPQRRVPVQLAQHVATSPVSNKRPKREHPGRLSEAGNASISGVISRDNTSTRKPVTSTFADVIHNLPRKLVGASAPTSEFTATSFEPRGEDKTAAPVIKAKKSATRKDTAVPAIQSEVEASDSDLDLFSRDFAIASDRS